MARIIEIHPRNPQQRLVAEVVATIRNGGLIAYPTDSSYALGCHIGDKRAMDRIRKIRHADKQHNSTLVCSELSEIRVYARVENALDERYQEIPTYFTARRAAYAGVRYEF